MPMVAEPSSGPVEAAAEAEPEALDGEALRAEPEGQSLAQAPMMSFDATGQTPWAIPFAFDDYLELAGALRPEKSYVGLGGPLTAR